MTGRAVLLALLLAAGLARSAPAMGEVSADAVALLEAMEPAYARVSGYTARFLRQEVIDERLRPREEALLKFQRPDRFYLRWIGGPAKGREMLYPGGDAGRVLVYEPGILTGLFTVALSPDSSHVLKESRHPATEIGIGRLVDLVLDNLRRGLRAGDIEVLDRGVAGGGERRVELVSRASRTYYASRGVIGVDPDTRLPVAVTIFDWHDRMIEDYAYRDVRLNPTLSAMDFDVKNPDYRFPRLRLSE